MMFNHMPLKISQTSKKKISQQLFFEVFAGMQWVHTLGNYMNPKSFFTCRPAIEGRPISRGVPSILIEFKIYMYL